MNSVTIIICCFNSAKRIKPVLKHLQRQKVHGGQKWEVIIVDNASIDNTSIIAEQIWSEDPVAELKIVYEEKPGLMNARQRGLAEAKYDIVSFIDDDNWVEDSWIWKVSDVFESDKTIAACGGISVAVFEKEKPEWFLYFENSFAVGKQANESGYVEDTKGFLWGAGLSFRRSLWMELTQRGFKNLTVGRQGKNITAGEDTELCYAFRLLGYRLYYKSDLQLFHFMSEGRMSFSYLEKMCAGFGKSFAMLNCYRVLLYPQTFKLFSWSYEWLAAIKKINMLRIQQLFTRDKLKQWRLKTDVSYWKGYAKQLWQTKGDIQKNISMLKSVFTLENNNNFFP